MVLSYKKGVIAIVGKSGVLVAIQQCLYLSHKLELVKAECFVLLGNSDERVGDWVIETKNLIEHTNVRFVDDFKRGSIRNEHSVVGKCDNNQTITAHKIGADNRSIEIV